jgi:hypothetical protein
MEDFDLAALSEALDAKRSELGLTWQQLAIQVTRPAAEFVYLIPDIDE